MTNLTISQHLSGGWSILDGTGMQLAVFSEGCGIVLYDTVAAAAKQLARRTDGPIEIVANTGMAASLMKAAVYPYGKD